MLKRRTGSPVRNSIMRISMARRGSSSTASSATASTAAVALSAARALRPAAPRAPTGGCVLSAAEPESRVPRQTSRRSRVSSDWAKRCEDWSSTLDAVTFMAKASQR